MVFTLFLYPSQSSVFCYLVPNYLTYLINSNFEGAREGNDLFLSKIFGMLANGDLISDSESLTIWLFLSCKPG
jgi:hypothetical protein